MKKLFIVLALLITTNICHAKELVLNVHQIRPDVIKEGEGFTGFGIDIGNAIAEINDYEYLIMESTFEQLLNNVKENKIDLAIAGISLTSTREADMNFSYAYLENGLGILTHGREKALYEAWLDIFWRIKWAILLTVLCIVGVFIVERRDQTKDDGINTISDSAWWVWSMGTTVGPGDKTPKTKVGRWMSVVLSLVLIAVVLPVYLDEFARSDNKEVIADIKDIKELHDKKVATVDSTTSKDEMSKIVSPENLVLTQNIEGAYKLLNEELVDAVVFDHSVLKYDYRQNNMEENNLVLIDEIFNPTPYAIAIPKENQELYEEIKVALRKLKENGIYDQIHFKWFGE